MVTPGWFLRMCLDSRVGERAGRGMNGRGRGEEKGKEDCPKGVSARCLRPLQLLLPHFVAWRHLEEMQMSWNQRDCIIV